jgi:O-antigen ligase
VAILNIPDPVGRALTCAAAVGAMAALSAACLALSADISWFAFVPAAIPLAAAAAAVVLLAAVGKPWAVICVFAALMFLTNGNFRLRPEGDTGLDWQGALKFALWTICGLIGATQMPSPSRILSSPGAALWLCYIAVALLSAFYAPNPVFSFGYSISLLSLYVFNLALVCRVTEAQILWTTTISLAFFLAACWPVYWFVPEMGRFDDPTVNGFVTRMCGIAGQPVNLGTVCAVYLGAVFLLVWKRGCGIFAAIPLAALGVATLAATHSRTAELGLGAAILAVVFSRSTWLLALVGAGGAAAVAWASALTVQLSSLSEQFSRSGSADELTTLTGRTQVWDYTWQKILESPFLGWGYNSSKVVLGEYVGFDASLRVDNAHNMLLQNLLSVGFIGTLPLAGLLLKLIVDTVRGRRDPLGVLFLTVVFISGITDPSAVGTTPTVLTIMFMMASIWPWRDADEPAFSRLVPARAGRAREARCGLPAAGCDGGGAA